MNDQPPFEAWFVVEVDIDRGRDDPLYASLSGPFADREQAERERDAQQEAWNEAIGEWDGGNPYDFKGWDIVEKHISDFEIERLERQDEESYRVMMGAVTAVGTALVDDDRGDSA